MKDYKIGIQLYSIREALKQDFKGVCRDPDADAFDLTKAVYGITNCNRKWREKQPNVGCQTSVFLLY